jgi:nucleoside-diphosphate-sugar epimerase
MTMVLVTGADGFIGRALCRGLLDAGLLVRGAVRGVPDSSRGARTEVTMVCVGDVGPATDWSPALEGVDVVIHCAARAHVTEETASDAMRAYRHVNVEGTRRLAEQAALRCVHRMVLLSSIGVNGVLSRDMRRFAFDDLPDPQEDYARSKHEAEQALLEVAARHTDLQTVIVRPPLVHGPGVKGNMLRLMGLVRRGVPLPFGRVVNRRSLVGVQNLVDLLVACVGHPRAAGEVLLLRDDQEVSTPELLRMIGFAMDTKDRVFDLPIGLMTLVGRATGRQRELERLFGSLMVDDAHTRSLLAWRPKRSLEDGVKEMVRWYLHENNQGG